MGDLIHYFVWLAVCVAASIIVALRIKIRRDRYAYFLLIWLVPYFGAAAAFLLSRRPTKETSTTNKMLEAIAEARRQNSST